MTSQAAEEKWTVEVFGQDPSSGFKELRKDRRREGTARLASDR